jgi:putative addiction module CopG family antidote
MPHRTTKDISLTPEFGDDVDRAVASGPYQTASEAVRAGLRMRARQASRKALPPLSRPEEFPQGRAAARGDHARRA